MTIAVLVVVGQLTAQNFNNEGHASAVAGTAHNVAPQSVVPIVKEATPVEVKVPEPQVEVPVPEPTPVVAERPVVTQATTSKTELMRQAGIPESDYSYVDYIVTKESSWNPEALNASSGACSLVQALPCSKIPGDWRNPVNALKWQHSYVLARYGGYAGAYTFWRANNWY